ncbi:hypothetical protein RND71_041208 [Anisodus tanguticus]|uniref:Cytochrome c-552/DMSO reductase-like haem-binding domain-containing protein n=1 Tax=Anisodus tanguticus TaxID=243964 RepID=A0AAE1UU30_9SOLA|nr:hypothetical protein RND71_041208 [Anisodus tanguticus]
MEQSLLLTLFLILIAVLGSTRIQFVATHQESGDWHCEVDEESRVSAEFKPGLVTLDGHGDDWENIDGFEFSLLPALDPDHDHEYKQGKMTVKALHDGKDVYFLLQVDGEYVYKKGNDKNCPSVALMFQVGESATYHSMGGCKQSPDACNKKTCRGHEVDIMHFSIGNAIPGRLYGGNPVDNRDANGGDRFGHLVDLYAWSPHCLNLDGVSPKGNDTSAQNDWRGAWWHSSFTTHSGYSEEDSPYSTKGQKGTFYFEFSRPLRTMDRLQQDVQFTIGQMSKFSAAFWYPEDGNAWHGSGHYTISCDWVPLDVPPGSSVGAKVVSRSSWDAISGGFAFLLSIVSFGVTIFIGYWVHKKDATSFQRIGG